MDGNRDQRYISKRKTTVNHTHHTEQTSLDYGKKFAHFDNFECMPNYGFYFSHGKLSSCLSTL